MHAAATPGGKEVHLIEQSNPTWVDLSDQWRIKTADLSTPLLYGRDDKFIATLRKDDRTSSE
jgi:hypothetical protein